MEFPAQKYHDSRVLLTFEYYDIFYDFPIIISADIFPGKVVILGWQQEEQQAFAYIINLRTLLSTGGAVK